MMKLYERDMLDRLGQVTQHAIKAFRRGWLLGVDGKAGTMTQRTLAYVTAVRA